MLKTVGLWPYQKTSTKICIRAFILIAIHSMMISQVIFLTFSNLNIIHYMAYIFLLWQILRTFEEWGKNSEIVIENLTGFFYFQAVLTKYIASFIVESKVNYFYALFTIIMYKFNIFLLYWNSASMFVWEDYARLELLQRQGRTEGSKSLR